jgi:hypothetical protein
MAEGQVYDPENIVAGRRAGVEVQAVEAVVQDSPEGGYVLQQEVSLASAGRLREGPIQAIRHPHCEESHSQVRVVAVARVALVADTVTRWQTVLDRTVRTVPLPAPERREGVVGGFLVASASRLTCSDAPPT